MRSEKSSPSRGPRKLKGVPNYVVVFCIPSPLPSPYEPKFESTYLRNPTSKVTVKGVGRLDLIGSYNFIAYNTTLLFMGKPLSSTSMSALSSIIWSLAYQSNHTFSASESERPQGEPNSLKVRCFSTLALLGVQTSQKPYSKNENDD